MRDKIVLVTRKTQLDELIERFNNHAQAKYILKTRGETPEAMQELESAHTHYYETLNLVREAIPKGVRLQQIERSFLPNFLFNPNDLVITLGPDGLVVNTAKYLQEQPMLALNPDPKRIDGVLIAFHATQVESLIERALNDGLRCERVTMAEARLDDGQTLYAVNDLFIGQRTHLSARYRISHRESTEQQSSSGIIVSTGAGSSGWYRSILAGAAGVVRGVTDQKNLAWQDQYQFDRTADQLRFCVREPFVSRVSQAGIIYGPIENSESLEITSQMPTGGVIFSDGIESDFLKFESGRVATIRVANRKVILLV